MVVEKPGIHLILTIILSPCRTLPNSLKLTFCNGTVLHRQQVSSTFGDWLGGITELSKSLQAIDIDASAYACLSALTLVNGETNTATEPALVDY